MRTNRGAWAISVMVAVGAVLGSVAVWFHYQQGRRSMEFWGPRQALAIRHAPRVEVLRLERSPGTGATQASSSGLQGSDSHLIIDGRDYDVAARCDIATARGLVHARHALIVDASFDWTKRSDSEVADAIWRFAIRFSGDGRSATVLLDPESRRIRSLDELRSVCLVPKIAAAEQSFFERELGRVEGRPDRKDGTEP